MSRSFAEDVAAVRADVTQAVHLVVAVASEEDRLVKTTLEQSDRRGLTGHSNGVDAAYELPRPCEDRLAARLEDRRIRVELARQGARLSHLGVDFELHDPSLPRGDSSAARVPFSTSPRNQSWQHYFTFIN